MKTEIKNARITKTSLDIERCLTAWLYLNYAEDGQAFGGWHLSGEWGCQFIKRLLETVGVEKWEDLPGKYIRVESENCKVHRIGHIIEDKWFDPQKDLNEFWPEEIKNVPRD